MGGTNRSEIDPFGRRSGEVEVVGNIRYGFEQQERDGVFAESATWELLPAEHDDVVVSSVPGMDRPVNTGAGCEVSHAKVFPDYRSDGHGSPDAGDEPPAASKGPEAIIRGAGIIGRWDAQLRQ